MSSQPADGSVVPLSPSARNRRDRAAVAKANCSKCGGPLLPVVYGLPGFELAEAERRGELLLGGCTVFGDEPTHSCACGHLVMGGSGEDDGGDLVEGPDPGAFDIDDAREYIAEVRWQFAKTMPQWPHEYSVRDWRSDMDDQFFAFVALILSDGVVKPWPRNSPKPRYHHRCFEIDGWDYWSMSDKAEDATLINRARLEDG